MSRDKNLEKSVIDAFLGLDIASLIDADVQSMSSPDLELWRGAIPDLNFSVSDQEMNGGEGIGGQHSENWRETNADVEADLKFWRQTRPDTKFRSQTSSFCPNLKQKLDIPRSSEEIHKNILKFKQNCPTNEEGVLGLRGLRKISESLEDGKYDICDQDFLVDEEGLNETDVLFNIECLLKDEESDEVKVDHHKESNEVKTNLPEDWKSPFPSPPILETDQCENPYFFGPNGYQPFSSNASRFQSPQSSFSSSPSVQDSYISSEYRAPPNYVGSYPQDNPKFSSPYLDIPNRASKEFSPGFLPSPQHSFSTAIGSRRVYPSSVETGSYPVYPSVLHPPPPFSTPVLKRWDTIPVDICRQNFIPATAQLKRSLDFPDYVHKPTYSTAAQRSNTGATISTIPRFSTLKKPQQLSSPSKKLTSKDSAKLVCGFCKQNGERREVYNSHSLGVPGSVTCPMLASHVCETCGATGEKAHTKTYCPKLRNEEGLFVPLPVALKNTKRKSDGRLRK